MLSACQPLALLGLFDFMLSITQVGRSSSVNEDRESEHFNILGQRHRDRKNLKLDLNRELPRFKPRSLNTGFTGDLQVPEGWTPSSFFSMPFTWSECMYLLCFLRINISQIGDAVHGKTNSTNGFTQKSKFSTLIPISWTPLLPTSSCVF